MSLVEDGHGDRGRRAGLHAGVRGQRRGRALSARHADRPGLADSCAAENVTQAVRRGAAGRRLRDAPVRARAAGRGRRREPHDPTRARDDRRHRDGPAAAVDPVLEPEAARGAARADVPRHDRDRDPRGAERGRGHRVRGGPRPGLPAEPAQGHHGAHAHPGRATPWGSRASTSCRRRRLLPTILVGVGTAAGVAFYQVVAFLLGSARGDVRLRDPRDAAHRALRRDPHADRVPAAAPGDRGRRGPDGWCGSRWRRAPPASRCSRSSCS